MEIKKYDGKEPAYPSGAALRIGAAIAAAGILLGSAAGCSGSGNDDNEVEMSGDISYVCENADCE